MNPVKGLVRGKVASPEDLCGAISNRMNKIIILVIIPVTLIILFLVFVNGKSGDSNPQISVQPVQTSFLLEEQKDKQRAVSVSVEPTSLGPSLAIWDFKIALDTHSVALDQDMTKASVLIDDHGNNYQPITWEGTEPGGHHRDGILKFKSINPFPENVTLIIKDIGGISQRIFKWKLN